MEAAVAAATGTIIIATIALEEQRKKRRKRLMWVRPLFQMRQQLGAYNLLMAEIRVDDVKMYGGFTRMSPEDFDVLLATVQDDITASSTFRRPIEPDMRLAVTLRYLATGESGITFIHSYTGLYLLGVDPLKT